MLDRDLARVDLWDDSLRRSRDRRERAAAQPPFELPARGLSVTALIALAGVPITAVAAGKALTGGYMTLAATLCTSRVAETITHGEGGALMHGPTYMANPLAVAAALASTQLIADGGWREDVPRIERALRDGLAPAGDLPGVRDVRVLGH